MTDLVTRLRGGREMRPDYAQAMANYDWTVTEVAAVPADAWHGIQALRAERDALRTRVSELESGKRTWEQDASRFKAAHDASFMQVVAERDALRALLARMVDLAEFWINREDRRGKSEQEWKTWHACGHGSNVMRDAKAALREKA